MLCIQIFKLKAMQKKKKKKERKTSNCKSNDSKYATIDDGM